MHFPIDDILNNTFFGIPLKEKEDIIIIYEEIKIN